MWRSDCVKEVTWLEEKLRGVFVVKAVNAWVRNAFGNVFIIGDRHLSIYMTRSRYIPNDPR